MKYRVGQKVRSLHETGEGVITALIDAHTVEVDFGDDFGRDVNIGDLIAIDSDESKYLGGETEPMTGAGYSDPDAKKPLTLGVELLEVSILFAEREDDKYQLSIVNPEPSQILYTVYKREKNSYHGLASGILDSGSVKDLAILSGSELERTRSFYLQVINFIPGKGHPHTPLVSEISWNKGQFKMPPKFIEAVGEPAWVFHLRKNVEKKIYEDLSDSDFIRVAREDSPRKEINMEIDLHLEELVDHADKVPPADALKIQMDAVGKALSDALVNHASSLILIHGVGAGKLKKEVHDLLRRTHHVKTFGPGDPKRYGNGATKVIFQ